MVGGSHFPLFQGLKPPPTISVSEKGEQPHQALALLQELQLRGLVPSVIIYSAAVGLSLCEMHRLPIRRKVLLSLTNSTSKHLTLSRISMLIFQLFCGEAEVFGARFSAAVR